MKGMKKYYEESYSNKIENKEADAVVFLTGELSVTGFSGKRTKPDFNYRFPNKDRMDKYLVNYFEGLLKSKERKIRDREDRKIKAKEEVLKYEVGTILYSSWGYDQTNVDFYQIVEKKGQTVVLKRIACESIEQNGWASDSVVAVKDSFLDREPIKKRIGAYGISLSSYSGAYIWDGKPQYRSWYA